ncbi:Afadin and alpha-actinin-binding-domain-containing protein [Trichophaea hybrida]|nr:Afadin and alpha-actinin-binding-domain-containing protein [Trichophaea hybrida]
MDPGNLKSASNYVNNQLASRGLVCGNPIDFAKPSKDPDNPARIINLVHELVQRRDKEAEQRENLAITIRSLQNTETKQTSTIESLKTKVSELERKNSVLEAQARSANSTIRTIESSAKSLRDESVRLKTLLAQVRTQCANDIRKRDMQIQKMKERLLDTRRGTRPTASTIVITGAQQPSRSTMREYNDAGEAIGSSLNPLTDETVDFLTTLSQTLADENDSILALLRQCLSTLKAVQGLPDDDHNPQTEEEVEDAVNPVVAPPANFESLSLELDTVMGSLQEMLNQPNYVPVEDLAEKEEEIAILKRRNEVLEEEWKKAIDLVDGWNKSLVASIEKAPDLEAAAGANAGKTPLKDITNGSVVAAAAAAAAEQVPRDQEVTVARRANRKSRGLELERIEEDKPEPVYVVTRKMRLSELHPQPRVEQEPEPEAEQEPEPELEQDSDLDFEPDLERAFRRDGTFELVGDKADDGPKPEPEPEPEPEHEQEREREPEPQPSSRPQENIRDEIIYEEEVIIVRTKPLAPSRPRSRSQVEAVNAEKSAAHRPRSRVRRQMEAEEEEGEPAAPRPRSRPSRQTEPEVDLEEQTALRPRSRARRQREPEAEPEPEESAESKKRRRSSRAKPKPSADVTATTIIESPPVKKVKRRSSRRRVGEGDAAFDA